MRCCTLFAYATFPEFAVIKYSIWVYCICAHSKFSTFDGCDAH